MSTRQQSPTIAQRRMSECLRQARKDAGVTPAAAGEAVEHDASWISRAERGEYKMTSLEVKALGGLYGLEPAVTVALIELAKVSRQTPWWYQYRDVLDDKFGEYIGTEDAAVRIRSFGHLPHGLLQTPEYARALIDAGTDRASALEVDRRVALRIERQRLLELPNPPDLNVILDEAALHRQVGGREVMRAQLQHLLKVSEQRHVKLQIMPFSTGAHAGADGSFALLDLPPAPAPLKDPAGDVVAYHETMLGCVFFTKPEEVSKWSTAWEHVCREALPTEESRSLVHRMAGDLT